MAKKRTRSENRAHRAFAAEYVRNGYNATEAYRTVYRVENDGTARSNSNRLLTKADVLDMVDEEQAKVLRGRELTRQRTLEELGCIAFLDPLDLLDEQGKLLPYDRIPDRARRAIAALEEDAVTGARKVRLASKLRALEVIGKAIGMFKEQIQHEGPVQIIVETGVSREPGEGEEE